MAGRKSGPECFEQGEIFERVNYKKHSQYAFRLSVMVKTFCSQQAVLKSCRIIKRLKLNVIKWSLSKIHQHEKANQKPQPEQKNNIKSAAISDD